MTRPRALTSTFRFIVALLTALLVSVVGAAALPAAALAGQGQAKGQQADRADNPGKAHEQSKAHEPSKPRPAPQGQSAGSAKGGSSDKAQAQKPEPSHGSSAQARETRTSHGAAASKSAGTTDDGDKADPPGNNGTVKLMSEYAPNGPGHSSGNGSTVEHPSNDPHLPCSFSVEWFGFDSGVTSSVSFEQHAPTRGGKPQTSTKTLHSDSHSGGGSADGFDGVEPYTLAFEGDPHPRHGYHVKLTTSTPYAQGSDSKHKVFWVEPCVESPGEETPGEETPGEETPGEETPGEETPGEETPGEETPGEETPGDNDGVQDTVNESGGTTGTVVFGAQASVQNSQGAQGASQQAAGGAQVPTAVAAGLTGDEWSRSVLPLLAVLFGFGTTFVALMRRRTRVQAVTRD